MAARLSLFEEFLLRFEKLKAATGDSPRRLLTFYDESREISEPADQLQNFLLTTDFERRIVYGRKLFLRAPPDFDITWKDYQQRWAPTLGRIEIRDLLNSFGGRHFGLDPDFNPEAAIEHPEPEAPDPKNDEAFDPRCHDLGAAIELGVEQLDIEAQNEPVDDYTERVVNSCRIASEAYDYLTTTIGLNIRQVGTRWRKVPTVFTPAHVANRYGTSDKGSLPHLLDNAVRAYVFGAPAAAFAMCRAAFEMILKRHYGEGEWENPKEKLSKVIALAAERGFIKREEIRPLIERADGILHRYSQESVLSADDERTILIFLATLKSLIERAPKA